MASNLEECGYDEFFTTEVPDELKCVICHLVLREPVQLMTCGHRFCSPCFNRMKVSAERSNTELSCPVDREAVLHGHVFPDKAASRTIGNLKVHCGNRDQGCPWVDDLRDLKNHEESCQFKIAVGMEEMSVKSGRDEELDAVIKQILARLQTCENEMLKKDKDSSNLRFTVDELKEDNKVKDDEIRMLKCSIEELKTDAKKKDDAIRELSESMKSMNGELQISKGSTRSIMQSLMDSEYKEMNRIENLLARIETMKMDLQKEIQQSNQKVDQNNLKMNKFNESIDTLEKESSRHVANLECALFAHRNLIEADTIKFDWVMQDYLHMFRIGDVVWSPIFHPKIGGYSLQLYVQWTGPNKGKMGLYLKLHRGKTPHRFLKDFNHEFTLAVYDKNGDTSKYHCDQADLRKFKGSFTIKKGNDSPDTNCGCASLLTAPYDDYIINNSLLISLTVHI